MERYVVTTRLKPGAAPAAEEWRNEETDEVVLRLDA